MAFTWWIVNEYGMAEPVPDSPAVSAAIDAGARGYYGSIEGAIINGGVLATAFKRHTERTYDSAAWLRDGAMVPAGSVTITEITAPLPHMFTAHNKEA